MLIKTGKTQTNHTIAKNIDNILNKASLDLITTYQKFHEIEIKQLKRHVQTNIKELNVNQIKELHNYTEEKCCTLANSKRKKLARDCPNEALSAVLSTFEMNITCI